MSPRARGGRAMSTIPRGGGRGKGRSPPLNMDSNGEKIGFLTSQSKVEVCSDEDGFKGAWFTGKIFNDLQEKTLGKRKIKVFVQYDDLLSCESEPNVRLIEAVETSYIRPLPPPPPADQIYEEHDVVDAFHRDGWWKGVVAKVEVLEEDKRSYNVVFENPHEEFTFCSKDLRFNLEWINGGWVKPPKQMEIPTGEKCEEQSPQVLNTTKCSEEKSSSGKKLWKKSAPLRRSSTRKKLNETTPESEDTHASYSKKLRMENCLEPLSSEDSQPIAMLIKSIEKKVKGSARESDGNLPLDGSDSSNKGKDAGTSQVMSQQVPAAVVEGERNTEAADISNQIESMDEDTDSSTRLAAFSRSNAENSSELPREEINIQKESNASEQQLDKGAEILPEINIQKENNASEQQQDKGEEDHVSEGTTTSKMDIDICAVPVAVHTTEVGASSNTVNDDLPLSTCLTREDDILNQPCVIDIEASEQVEKPEMPFPKTSSLWQTVDSLEVFKVLPQNPHFSPLLELDEAIREGFAIGNMLNFAGMVEKVPQLKINQPRSVFDSYLKILADLEMHGFNVKAVVDRIKKLLSIKTRDEEVKNQSKDLESKLAEYDTEKAKLEEDVSEMQKTIRKLEEQVRKLEEQVGKLEEQVAMKVVQKVAKYLESSDLQKDLNRLNDETSKGELDFEREAGAPWKFS